ncbi:hypothetical protein HMI55_003313, partial [Coelomomyces lativittatus]
MTTTSTSLRVQDASLAGGYRVAGRKLIRVYLETCFRFEETTPLSCFDVHDVASLVCFCTGKGAHLWSFSKRQWICTVKNINKKFSLPFQTLSYCRTTLSPFYIFLFLFLLYFNLFLCSSIKRSIEERVKTKATSFYFDFDFDFKNPSFFFLKKMMMYSLVKQVQVID